MRNLGRFNLSKQMIATEQLKVAAIMDHCTIVSSEQRYETPYVTYLALSDKFAPGDEVSTYHWEYVDGEWHAKRVM